MIDDHFRQTILAWREKGLSLREISRRLGLSRHTVQRVVRGEPSGRAKPAARPEGEVAMIKEAYSQCRGNIVRVQEVLRDKSLSISYSTLTRLARSLGLKKVAPKRAGVYSFTPGQEMQHDTSPHRVIMAGKTTPLICSSLVLGWSRRLFVRYFKTFTRFEARVFLTEAITFMEGACERCIIDNTSVLVAGGSGPAARIAPEMEALGRLFGTVFKAHRVNDPNRKGKVERPFAYIENNFLAGRTFHDLDDLNRQARDWCVKTANQKVKRVLGVSPEEAYRMERPCLKPIPPLIPPVYQALPRVVDVEGYVNLETNRYSVPDRFIGKTVEVQKHWEQVLVFFDHLEIAAHRRIMDKRNTRITAPGHHRPLLREKAHLDPSPEEKALLGQSQVLDQYVVLLRRKSPGRGLTTIRRLLSLKRTYPEKPFQGAVVRALTYGLTDMARLEKIIIENVAGDFFLLREDHEKIG